MSQSPTAPTGLGVPVIDVSDAAGLKAALAAATGGETIRLAAGSYGSLALSNFHVPVTLVGDPAAPAVLTGFDLDDVDGLSIDGLTFDYTYRVGSGTWADFASVQNSRDITIRNAVFDGDVASGTGTSADGTGAGRGLRISASDNILIENSELHTFWKGLGIGDSTNVTVRNNDFHSMRSDVMSISATDNLLIENNHFHDRLEGPEEDHGDMIQAHSRGATAPLTNLTIRGNLFDIGDGDRSQSVFLANEAVSKGAGYDMFLKNVVIENNVILNAQSNALVVGAVDGLVLRNNTVLHAGQEGAEETATAASTPRIEVESTSMNVTIERNVTSAIIGHNGQPDWTVANNFLVQNTDPELPDHYTDHFLSPYGQLGGHSEKLMLRADSPIAMAGAGAPALLYDPTPDHLTALILPEEQTNRAAWLFDARLTAGPGGPLDSSTAQFDWVFSDGVTARGIEVLRQFDHPGSYRATLTVTAADGSRSVTDAVVKIFGSDLIGYDGASGTFLGLAEGESVVIATPPAAAVSGQTVNLGALASPLILERDAFRPIFEAGDFELAMRLAGNSGGGSGEILCLRGALKVSVDKAGEVLVNLTDINGASYKLTTSGARMKDGAWHDVLLDVDPAGGTVSVTVDGRLLVQKALGAPMAVASGRDLQLGNGYNGKLADFDLHADAGDFVYGHDLQVIDPHLPPAAPAAAQMLQEPAAALPAGPTDSGELLALKIDEYEQGGRAVSYGTDGAESLRAGKKGGVLVGQAGNDVLGDNIGDDVMSGGDGADKFVFDLRAHTGPGHDLITDFSFADGDWLQVLTAEAGSFWNDADTGNALRLSDDGSCVQLRSFADLAEAVAAGALDVAYSPDGAGLLLAVAHSPDRVLELAFFDAGGLLFV
ncbi:MAG: right-handed parallel beta-helix repeat-containing protein [Mangrovicoccus sp.]|nr:right-handed parallel beta-helix repeat-containing protein [Mangrovicoccus sp.]